MPDLPYVLNNGKIAELFDKVTSAARPDRFSQDFLEKLGYSSSNDRAFIPLLRRLGFIDDSGVPKAIYDDLRDATKRPYTLAQQIRELYSDLFAVNTSINSASDADIKAAVARVTGKEEAAANRMANTFKALVQQARFDAPAAVTPPIPPMPQVEVVPEKDGDAKPQGRKDRHSPQFHYNIQIVLPTVTEVAVYNAIFRSLRENLDL